MELNLQEKFIEEILVANPLHTAVFVYTTQTIKGSKILVSPSTLAQKFGVSEMEIISAFQYWQAKMFIHLKFGQELEIEFIEQNNEEDTAPQEAAPQNLVYLKTNQPKPTYSPMELEMYKDKYGNIAHLFNTAEKSLGRLLSASELSTIFSFYDWLRLPIDVIELLLEYCAEGNHRNINYIEAIAVDWSENKINNLEIAQNHIQNFNKNYREVLKAVGQGSREATNKEKAYIDKWINQYNLPLDIVLEACDKTIMNVGKPKFSYTDKILETWYQNNVKTLSDIIELENKFKDIKASAPVVKANTATNASKFANYSSSNAVDYSTLEDVEMALMKNLING